MERFKGVTIIFLLAFGLLVTAAPPFCLASGSSGAKPASVLLQEGLYAEEIEGNLDAAIKIYEQVIAESKETQRAAAQARYRIGMCFLKKGEKAKAAEQFQDLISKYPEQKTLVTRSRERLTKLGPPAVGGFGPVMERVINDDGEEKDWLIDFDTGRLFSHSIEIRSEEMFLKWIAENRIDAMGETRTSSPGLYCFDMAVIPIAAETWETISPKGLVHDLSIAKGGIPVVISAVGNLPVTYTFKTREGGMGVVQILEMQDNKKPRHFRIRYKMLQEAEETAPTEVLGPVIERVIYSEATGKPFFFDLDTGQAFYPPAGLTRYSPEREVLEWSATKGIDFVNSRGHLELVERTSVKVVSGLWDSATPAEIKDALLKGSTQNFLPTRSKDYTISSPITYVFKTREGGIGILQILEKKDNNLRIRYKMLQKEKAKSPIDLSTPEATIKSFVNAVYNGNLEAAKACVSKEGHDYDEFMEMLATESNHPFQAMIKAMDGSIPIEITSKDITEDRCKIKWYFTLGRVYYFGETKMKKGTHQEFSSYLEFVGDKWLIRDI